MKRGVAWISEEQERLAKLFGMMVVPLGRQQHAMLLKTCDCGGTDCSGWRGIYVYEHGPRGFDEAFALLRAGSHQTWDYLSDEEMQLLEWELRRMQSPTSHLSDDA